MELILGLIAIGIGLICGALWTGECVIEVLKIMIEEEQENMEINYLTSKGAYEED